MVLATNTLIAPVVSLLKLIILILVEIKFALLLPNLFRVIIGFTLNTTLPSTNTWLTSLLLIQALMYRGFKCWVISSKGLVNYLTVGFVIVSSNNFAHSASLANTSLIKLLG